MIRHRFSPLEAGLMRSIHFQKGCFVGNEVVSKAVLTKAIRQKLTRLEIRTNGMRNTGMYSVW